MSRNIEKIIVEKFEAIGIKITDERIRQEVYAKAEEAVGKAAERALKPRLLSKLLMEAIRTQKKKPTKPEAEALQ